MRHKMDTTSVQFHQGLFITNRGRLHSGPCTSTSVPTRGGKWQASKPPPPPSRRGMQMLNANPYHEGTAAEQKGQNKKLFSDIAIGTFHCDRKSTLK